MRFLTYKECEEWCSSRRYPLTQIPGQIIGPIPDLQPPVFSFVDFIPPTDSGQKVFFARHLYSLVDASPELLLWIGDWSVWPSSQHMPLFTRFREAFGEQRPLIEAPGHVLVSKEADDAISIISLALFFIWNCHILSASGRDAIFISHDEFGWFASRDEAVAESIRQKMEMEIIDTTDPGVA